MIRQISVNQARLRIRSRPLRQAFALVLAVLWVAAFPLLAATNGITPFSVRIWQTDDGLPQNSVFGIAQTSDGYLWVGTQEGLARFDGLRFTLVEDPAVPELKHASIKALCVSRDGSLWIATESSGLIRMRMGKFSRYSETSGLPSNQTRCLMESRDGALWIGTEGGLARFKDEKFTAYTEKSGLADVSIRGLCEDRQGDIRIATRRGLSALSPDGSIRTMNFGLGTVANALKAVCEDKAGDIWVASNEGVTRRGASSETVYTVTEGLPDNLATALFHDANGRIWAGTYSGLACFIGGKVVSRPMNDAGFADLVYAVFEDREENLWVGARDGLYRLRPLRFTTFTMQEGLTSDNVMSVCEDRSGTIYMATWGGGLNRLRDGQVTSISYTNGLTHDKALSVHEGRDGSLWVGMDFDGGLNRLRDGGRNSFPRQEGLINAPIRVVHEDAAGNLWLGTGRGLNILRQGKFTSYTTTKGLAGNNVTVIYPDHEGRMWIGTDGGLSRWEKGKFANFTTEQGLSHNFVNAIYEDAQHTLWIGTKGGGLNRFHDGKFTAYTTKQGLFSDEIYEILEDDLGCFWMSCRKGIFRIKKAELDQLDRKTIEIVNCAVFGKADGLVSVQCNGVAKPSGWKARDGRLWFPTIRGVVAVEPRIKTNHKPPPVVIEAALADQRSLSWDAAKSPEPTLTIAPGRGELEVRYTALSLQAPERNHFKYRLEGVDPDWNDAGVSRVARYFNIEPGRYRFQVIACNNDGVWNPTGAAMAFVFEPHAWQTWWFKLAIVLAIILVLVALYRYRVARLREIENLRVQIAADLHDDVGSRLTKVAMVTEWLDRETPFADRNKSHIKSISRTTREIIQAMDEIVWTINPKNDTLDNLANYIFQYAQDYFQNSGVRCRLDLPARLPEQPVSTQERHNLFMAVKEALNNVLKHANATEVRISLAVEQDRLIIVIADNGRGLGEKPLSAGDGLANMKTRLSRIGGRLLIQDNPTGGVLVRMEASSK